jgi:hypothetical protein
VTVFTVTLRTRSEGAHRRLRELLKYAGRRLDMRALDVREIQAARGAANGTRESFPSRHRVPSCASSGITSG